MRSVLPLAGVLATLVSVLPSRAAGEEQIRLDRERVERLCEKYVGQPALVQDGELVKIHCPWIERLAASRPNLVGFYRGLLGSAKTLDGLRPRARAAGLDCGAFRARTEGGERILVCTANVGAVVRVTFHANAAGALGSVEVLTPHRRLYRAAYEKAVKRGEIEKVFDAFTDLQADLFVEAVQQSVHGSDVVTVRGEEVLFRIAAIPVAP